MSKATSLLIKTPSTSLEVKLAEQKEEKTNMNKTENLPDDLISKKITELSQSNKYLLNSVDELKKALATKEFELEFERIYNMIFGSQLSFLEFLITNGKLKFGQAYTWYGNIQHQIPDLTKIELNRYLYFLLDKGLIGYGASTEEIEITDKGRAFVGYIRLQMRYTGYKPF